MDTKKIGTLHEHEISAALAELPDWKRVDGKIHRDYVFKDFVSAFSFMAGAALLAQGMDHHPEWSNAWNKVHVDLSTHDADGITALDVALARQMESLAAKQPR